MCIKPIKECLNECQTTFSQRISSIDEKEFYEEYLRGSENYKNHFLHTDYDCTLHDMKTIQVHLFFQENKAIFLLTFVLSILTAVYGVTKFFRYSRAKLFTGNWKIWQCVVIYGTNCAWIVARGAALAFFMLLNEHSMIVNVIWYVVFFILPSFVFALVVTFGRTCYDTNRKSGCGCSVYSNHALNLFLKDPPVILAPVFTPFMFVTKLELEADTDHNMITSESVVGTSLKLSRKCCLFTNCITFFFATIGFVLKSHFAWQTILPISLACLLLTSIFLQFLIRVINWEF